MSAHLRNGVVSTADAGVLHTDNHAKITRRAPVKAFGLVILILAVLFAVVYGSYVTFWGKHNSAQQTQGVTFASVADAEQAASTASNAGHYETALTDLQSVVSKAETKQQKVNLYSTLAGTAQNAGKLQLAIQYYQQKHQLDPTTASADGYLLGELYRRTGQNTQAVAQYKLYETYVQANASQFRPYSTDAVLAPIKAQIQALGGQ